MSSRIVSLLLSVSIAIVTTAFTSLLSGVSAVALLVCFTMAFFSSYLLFYFALEFLVFREINEAYRMIEKLRKKDFKIAKKRGKPLLSFVKKLNQEIYTYGANKQKEIDHLKQMEVFRREFLADVSHELKTPIFAAQGFLHTLLDGAMDDENVRDKFLLKAVKSLDGLNTMIQDLLTLSKMEAGFIKMDYDIFDISLLTRDVFEQLEEQAAHKNITLRFDKPYQEVMAYADAKRIRQVMINLLENAIKYGSKNGNVEVGFSPNDHNLLDIMVKDDGPGISIEHLDRIFERFYRIEKSRSKDKGGSGLGLAIVKHILTAHETEIKVNSKVKKGTAFTFQLQTTPAENEDVTKVTTPKVLEIVSTES